MEDIGSLIFYIVLGLIALAGSFQGKGKKKPGSPKPVQRKPETVSRKPPVRTTAQTNQTMRQERPAPSPVMKDKPVSQPSPWFLPSESDLEGEYEEPMAGDFSREGNIPEPMAGAFTREGSATSGMSEAFSREGSIADSMAAAYASEGVSSLGDSTIETFVHNEISDSEIGDAPDFDYHEGAGAEIHTSGLDLKKAVIYSAVLDRKEYSY
ncbi:hypothetical protein EG830_15765 [bacterium]|nr:hypothetical protein [bacterium]